MTLIQTKSLPKGKGFFLLRWKEKQHQCLIKHQCRFTRLIFISVQNDIWILFYKVLHFFRIAVNAKEYKIFISVLLMPIYFFCLFKQVIIHINIKRFLVYLHSPKMMLFELSVATISISVSFLSHHLPIFVGVKPKVFLIINSGRYWFLQMSSYTLKTLFHIKQ